MSEERNAQLINQAMRLLMQMLVGTNSFNLPGSGILPGKSFAHSYSTYQQMQEQQQFNSPIAKSISSAVGDRIYESSLRLMGWSQKDINDARNRTGGQFMRDVISFGADLYLNKPLEYFGNTAQRRMFMNPSVGASALSKSFTDAGAEIIKGIGDGSIQGYSIEDALKVSTLFTRQGKYDFTDNSQRATKMKKDLQDYAEGINNLRDALQGSLEQVLDSFEKLTGSSATIMQKDRFTAISRGLYGATTIGGVTPQLLQSAIATQHATLQGLGATQATSATLGTLNANILANGVSVEGASQNLMNEALTRQSSRWMATGKAKELTAAFGWWADTQGKARTAETFEEFRSSVMNGNLSETNVRRYLQRNKVSGTYINSARNARNMASPYIYQAFHEQNVQSYENAFSNFQARNGLKATDMYLTDDELFQQLSEREKQRTGRNSLSRSALDRITQTVESRRNIIRGITQTTDADNGLNILRNQKQMLNQQQVAQGSVLLQGLLGQQTSIGGIAGVIQHMIKDKGISSDTIGGILSSYLGTDVRMGDLKGKNKSQIMAEIRKATGLKSDVDVEKAVGWAVQNVPKMHDSERSLLFNTSKDKQEYTITDASGKKMTGKWGDLRKKLVEARRTGDTDTYNKLLAEAQKHGFIDEKSAFLARYGAENKVDFNISDSVKSQADQVYAIYEQTKDMKLKDEGERHNITSAIARIRSGGASDIDKENVMKALQNSDMFKEKREALDKAKQSRDKDAVKKAQESLDNALKTSYDKLTKAQSGNMVDFFLEEIVNLLKSIATKP